MDQLQLGLSLPLIPIQNSIKRNRLLQTLPLLSWNDKPDDPHHPPPNVNTFSSIHNSSSSRDEEKNQGVGWPPIESWRKKTLHDRHAQQPQHRTEENRGHDNYQSGGAKSLFVKVKMERIGIARKVDLELYDSHHSLKNALLAMFSTYQAIDIRSWDFTLIYEDKDGDWLLAEDLPWNSFVESVQRLKILVRKRNRE